MGKTLLAAMLLVGFTSMPVSGQATRPSEDALRKELRDLRAYADRLEEKLRERQNKPFEFPAPNLTPRDGAPPDMPNAIPRWHFYFEKPAPLIPSPPRAIPSPRVPSSPSTRSFVLPDVPKTIPPTWKKYRFNGQDVYVIPLQRDPGAGNDLPE